MTLVPAGDAAQLAAQRELASELPQASSERVVVDRVLGVLERLLPGRGLAVRAVDLRNREPVRGYVRGALLRENIGSEPLVLSQATLDRVRLKVAVSASARLIVRERWDSPFTGIATGFAMALAAGGELYGVLDCGYRPGDDGAEYDEPALRTFAHGLSIALRTISLQEDAIGLRDYQARLLDSANAVVSCCR